MSMNNQDNNKNKTIVKLIPWFVLLILFQQILYAFLNIFATQVLSSTYESMASSFSEIVFSSTISSLTSTSSILISLFVTGYLVSKILQKFNFKRSLLISFWGLFTGYISFIFVEFFFGMSGQLVNTLAYVFTITITLCISAYIISKQELPYLNRSRVSVGLMVTLAIIAIPIILYLMNIGTSMLYTLQRKNTADDLPYIVFGPSNPTPEINIPSDEKFIIRAESGDYSIDQPTLGAYAEVSAHDLTGELNVYQMKIFQFSSPENMAKIHDPPDSCHGKQLLSLGQGLENSAKNPDSILTDCTVIKSSNSGRSIFIQNDTPGQRFYYYSIVDTTVVVLQIDTGSHRSKVKDYQKVEQSFLEFVDSLIPVEKDRII